LFAPVTPPEMPRLMFCGAPELVLLAMIEISMSATD
jgi:hypothetical protein